MARGNEGITNLLTFNILPPEISPHFRYSHFNYWEVAGSVNYGGPGGTRVVETLRLIMAELQVATVRAQLALSLRTDFLNLKEFKPAAYQVKSLNILIDQVISWGNALKRVRLEVEEVNSQGIAGKSEEQRPSLQ